MEESAKALSTLLGFMALAILYGYEEALKLAGQPLRGTADMYVGLSQVACERNDLDAARQYLLGPVLHDANYITGSGDDTRVLWGCLLDLVNALTAIGTAVAVFPVVRRQNEAPAGRSALNAISR